MTIDHRQVDTIPASRVSIVIGRFALDWPAAGAAQQSSLEAEGRRRLGLVRLDRHGDAQGDELFKVELGPLTMRDEQQRNASLVGFEGFP